MTFILTDHLALSTRVLAYSANYLPSVAPLLDYILTYSPTSSWSHKPLSACQTVVRKTQSSHMVRRRATFFLSFLFISSMLIRPFPSTHIGLYFPHRASEQLWSTNIKYIGGPPSPPLGPGRRVPASSLSPLKYSSDFLMPKKPTE